MTAFPTIPGVAAYDHAIHFPLFETTEGIKQLKAITPTVSFQPATWVISARDGTVCALGGVCIPWPGRADAWFIPQDYIGDYPSALRALHRLLNTVEAHFGIRRMAATVYAADDRAFMFALWMGFEAEALLHRYMPDGSDAISMIRGHNGRSS